MAIGEINDIISHKIKYGIEDFWNAVGHVLSKLQMPLNSFRTTLAYR